MTAAGQPAQAAGAKAVAPATSVEMPFLIAPMSKDGKLLGYAYISSKMITSSPATAIAVREKLVFIQDAYVRDVYAQPIGKAEDPGAVDEALLNARLVAAAKRIVGSGKIVSMVFLSIQFMPLHPGEAPVPPPENASGTGDAAQADRNNGQTDASAAASAPATSKPAQDAAH
ncbi:MAG TPA: hypothetical protein VGC27_13115 [Rhizomicrobium sp.]